MKQISVFLKSTLVTCLLVFSTFSFGQQSKEAELDSLLGLATNTKVEDSLRIETYYRLAREFVFSNPDSAEYFVYKGLEISERIKNKNGLGEAYGWIGYLNAEKGNIATAIEFNLKSLYLAEEQGLISNYPVILNNLAQLHTNIGNDDQAYEYYLECVEINSELGELTSLATNYNNIGSYFRTKEDFKSSLNYYRKSIDIRNELKEYTGISYTYSNMGSVYEQIGNLDTALYFYKKGFRIRDSLNLNKAKALSLYKIGNIYLQKKDYAKAKKFADRSYQIASKWGYKYETHESAKLLYKINKQLGKHQLALNYFEIYSTIRDSINNIENQRATLQSKYQFEYNKKHLLDSLEKDKILLENKLLDEENKVNLSHMSVQRLWLTIAVLGIIILIIIIFASRKNSKARMDNLRAEIKLRLNETLKLKDEIELISESSPQSAFPHDLNIVLHDKLTEREQEILDALVLGLSNKEIGEKLFLSVNTIKTHILSLYTKLDVKNRTQAAIKGSLLKIQENQ